MSEYVDDAAVAVSRRKQHERMGERLLNKTRAYGKLILFGEHFVVYKVPALVGAVAAYTDCEAEVVEGGTGVEVIDNRPAVPNYKTKKQDEGDQAIGLVLKHFGISGDTNSIKLTFGGDLTCVSGIGASAAQVVSLA
jgi:mevalonate kinase